MLYGVLGGQVWHCDGQEFGGQGVRLYVRRSNRRRKVRYGNRTNVRNEGLRNAKHRVRYRNRRWALRLCNGANVGSKGMHGRRVWRGKIWHCDGKDF